MGFVVEPYCTFLCYEIKDMNIANSLLPEGFEMIKTKIKENDEAKYYGCLKAGLVAFANGAAPMTAVEFARKTIFSFDRPPSSELEPMLKEIKPR